MIDSRMSAYDKQFQLDSDFVRARRWSGNLETPDGLRWKPRLEAAERYHLANSWDWEPLRQLYAGYSRKVKAEFRSTVNVAWAIISNMVSDIYFKNPEPWIQSRNGSLSPDIAKMLRAVFRTIHKRSDSETAIKKALITESFAGFGGIWTSFKQYGEEQPLIDQTGQPILDSQSGQQATDYQATEQELAVEFVPPWRLRFDPDGRDHKLRDHKFITRIYKRTVAEFLADPDYTDVGKRMLLAWAGSKRSSFVLSPDAPRLWDQGYTERDIRYLLVPCAEVWSLAEERIWHIPIGSSFDLGSFDYPAELLRAKRYPLSICGMNWEPDDITESKGFYPIPTLRLVRDLLEDLIRLHALFMESSTLAVRKYLAPEGLIDANAMARITSDVNREIITINLDELRANFGGTPLANLNEFDLRRLITLLPADDRAEMMKFAEAIDHTLNMIYQVTGQGPADRGGVAAADSATEAANIRQMLDKRIAEKVEVISKVFDDVSNVMFLMLKERQTLPIAYSLTGDAANMETWHLFQAEQLTDLDLAFDHEIGSSRARNKEAEAFNRKEVGSVLLPVLANLGKAREALWIAKWMIEPLEDDLPPFLFDDQIATLAMGILQIQDAILSGQADATDPRIAAQKADMVSQLVQRILSPAQMQQVAMAQRGGAPGGSVPPPAPGGTAGIASLPSPQSSGSRAYHGSQAAGVGSPAGAAGATNVAT